MKKRLIAILSVAVLAVLCLLFVGCEELGGNYTVSVKPEGSDESYDYVISVGDGTGTAVPVNATYTVLLSAGEGVAAKDSVELGYGKSVLLPNATRDGYVFDGWYTSPEGAGESFTYVTADSRIFGEDKVLLLYARYSRAVTITYVLGDGVSYTRQTSEAMALAPATKDGYAFCGWYSDPIFTIPVDRLQEDAVVYARFTPLYRVTYVLAGGRFETSPVETVTAADVLELPAPTRDRCDFLGWQDGEGDPVSVLQNTTADVVLYAQWSPMRYVITWQSGGVDIDTALPTGYTKGDSFALPRVRAEGKIFCGWYVGGQEVEAITATDEGDKVFVAKWYDSTVSLLANAWAKSGADNSTRATQWAANVSKTIDDNSTAYTYRCPDELQALVAAGKVTATVSATFEVKAQTSGDATLTNSATLLVNGVSAGTVYATAGGGGYSRGVLTDPLRNSFELGSAVVRTQTVTRNVDLYSPISLGYSYRLETDKVNTSFASNYRYTLTALSITFAVIE